MKCFGGLVSSRRYWVDQELEIYNFSKDTLANPRRGNNSARPPPSNWRRRGVPTLAHSEKAPPLDSQQTGEGFLLGFDFNL